MNRLARRIAPMVLVSLLILPFATNARGDDHELWFYYPTNMLVDKNIDRLREIWERAAKAGYTHVLLEDSKLARLEAMDKHYFANVDRVKQIAAQLHLEIVPAVFPIGYSNDMLWHDPNLAEGLPVRDAPFIVHDGEARLVPDPAIGLREKFDWKDDGISLGDGVATVRDNAGNARLSEKVKLTPFRCYHISVKVKTTDYTGTPQIQVLVGQDHGLNYTNLGVKRTQDWTEHHIIFNSLDNSAANVYFGVWGGAKGTLEWKDWKLEEVGLLNVLRRPGTPCSVKGYVEGKDYEPIVDPHLGNTPWAGEYDIWHEPAAIKTHLPEGTKLLVSWYHPVIIYDGQVPICFDEPKTMDLMADQAKRVKAAFGSAGYMMSHDEIRVMNWDESCQSKHETPGRLLADNVRQCAKLLGDSTVYVWSDMFDPYHNAVKGPYYLVNGDLSGSWDGLDKSVVMVNWNFEKRDQSLKFFADRGQRQLIAGYYDSNPEGIRDWLMSADKVHGVIGVMYTTWENQYDDLEKFAEIVKGK